MERRRSPRHTVDRPAKIIVPGGGDIPARICNESNDGAMLNVRWRGWLPKSFDLEDAFSGVRRAVETVWQNFSRMGVRFKTRKTDEEQDKHEFGHRHR
jgi:hypothetical protein